MKKVNLFKLMTACMAFAAVTFTSCSEEDMTLQGPGNVTIPGMPEIPETPVIPASASVAVSVYDVESEVLLGVTSVDATENIGATMEVACPEYKGYIVAPAIDVEIPALNDGQAVVVPVMFYVATEESEAAKVLEAIHNAEPVASEEIVLVDEEKEYQNIPDDHGQIGIIKTNGGEKYKIFKGMEYLGQVEAPESKGLVEENGTATGYEFVEEVLKACKEHKYGTWEWAFPTFWTNPYHQTVTTVKQVGTEEVYKITFNGSVFYAKFKVAGAANWTMAPHTIIEKYAHDWAHTHSHGKVGHDWFSHSHGDANINAGGGIVEAE